MRHGEGQAAQIIPGGADIKSVAVFLGIVAWKAKGCR